MLIKDNEIIITCNHDKIKYNLDISHNFLFCFLNIKYMVCLPFMIQINTSIVLCYLLNAKKDRMMFVSTCVTK